MLPPASAEPPAAERPSIGELVAGLEHEDAAVRRRSVEALGRRGEEAMPAVAPLLRALEDPDGNVRVAAATALGELALAPDRVIPALRRAMEDQTPSGRIPVWAAAGLALGRYGEAAVPTILRSLQDERFPVHRAAILAVATAGPVAKDAVPTLIRAVDSDDSQVRIFALNALIAMGPDAQPAVPVLIATLDHEDFHTQYWSCRALGAIGPDARPATSKLIERVRSGLASVRRNAAAALGKIGPSVGPEAVTALRAALSDPSQFVRQQAVIALGKLGPLAAPAVPDIEQGLRKPIQFRPAAQAAKTLWLLKPESDQPRRVLLAELADNGEPWEAAAVLGEIGMRLGVLDDVIGLLESDDRWTRIYAAMALGQMGPDAAGAHGALEKLLDDQDEDVRQTAQEAIRKVGG